MINRKSIELIAVTFAATTAMFYAIDRMRGQVPAPQPQIQQSRPAPITVEAAPVAPLPTLPVSTPAALELQLPDIKVASVLPTPANSASKPVGAAAPRRTAVLHDERPADPSRPEAAPRPAPPSTPASAPPAKSVSPPGAAAPEVKPAVGGRTVHVKSKTKLCVTLSQTIALESTQAGQSGTFTGTLNKSVRAGKDTIADEGSPVEGRFESARDGKGLLVLQLTVLRIRTVTGAMSPVDTEAGKKPRHLWLKIGMVAGAVVTVVYVPGGVNVIEGVGKAYNERSKPTGTSLPAVPAGKKLEFKLSREVSFVLA